MEMNYLIDSNVVIDYLAGKFPKLGKEFMNTVVNDIPVISVITKIEILGFTSTTEAESLLREFIEASHLIVLSDTIIDKTIELRKTTKIKLPDAIIAATCLVSNLILITHNIQDFKNIPYLEIIDPYNIQ